MITEKFLEVLQHEGVVAIATQGEKDIHMSNTWNSYMRVTPDGRILLPVGGMKTTEANINFNNKVLMTLGSREVQGFRSKGTGFLVRGVATFLFEGDDFEMLKKDYSWARAVLEIRPESVTQTL